MCAGTNVRRTSEDHRISQPRQGPSDGGGSAVPTTPALITTQRAEKQLSSIPLDLPPSRTGLTAGQGLCVKRTIVVSVTVFVIIMIIVFLRITGVIDLIGPSFPDLN